MGLFYPSLLTCTVIALAAWFLLDWLMIRTSAWRFFWHPPIARLALFFVIFGAVSAVYPDF